MPIDTFFYSLAADLKQNAIGVILSGTASDGTLGLRAIKAEGGITFAQDQSAKFDSMPRNAVTAGVVDFVLSPSQIARELSALAKHSSRTNAAPPIEKLPAYNKLMSLLRSTTDVDFLQYKQATVRRRLMRRLLLHRMDDLDQYLNFVQQNPKEVHGLYEDLLINVTEFFRDPSVFEALRQLAFPAIMKDRKPGDPIRVWVPGCSTGEEVYSLAISLVQFLEAIGAEYPLQIFGTDISERAVDKARTGVYSATAVSSVPQNILRRFFVKTDAGFQIARSIREVCIFSRQNVTRDPPLSRMDLISCRNLLIYLGPVLQKRVIGMFGYALQPTGCLVLGTA